MKRIGCLLFLLCLALCLPALGEQIIEPTEPVPEFVEQLLEVARGEIGYTENKKYTKYGEWAGDPTAEWCAEFLCWCVDQVDQRHGTNLLKVQYPLYGASNVGRNWFIKEGRYIDRKGNVEGWGYQWFLGEEKLMKKDTYIPQPGDWVFFTWTSSTDTDHVAMVEHCTMDEAGLVTVHVIEGNNPDTVARNAYPLDSWKILGYGTVHKLANTTIIYGNEGADVLALQKQLVELGLLSQRFETGYFGSNTRAAIKEFQKKLKGVAVSGIANIQTMNALEKALEAKRNEDPENFLVSGDDD